MKSRSNRASELRRAEAKRQRQEQRGTALQRVLSRVSPLVLLIWLGFCVCILVVLMSGGESLPWRLGQTVNRDIHARVAFKVEDQTRTLQGRQIARASAPSVYTANAAPVESIRGQLTELFTLAKSTSEDIAGLQREAAAKGWNLTPEAATQLRQYAGDEASKKYEAMVSTLTERLANESIVEPARNTVREQPPRTSILQRGTTRIEIATTTLQYCTNMDYVQRRARQLAADIFPPAMQNLVSSVIARVLTASPDAPDPGVQALWRYDREATKKEIDDADKRVVPVLIRYDAGGLLVESGTVLTGTELALLKQEHQEFLKAQRTVPELRRKQLLHHAGLAGLILVVTFGLAAYTLSYQGRIFQKPARAFGLASLSLLVVLLSRLVETPWDAPVEFSVAFVVMAAILLAIAYSQRFAFGVCGVLAILVTLAVRSDLGDLDLGLFLTLLAAAGVAVFTLNEVRTRGKIIAVGFFAGLAAFLTTTFSSLIAGQEARYVLSHAVAAATASIAAGFVVQGVLHYFERLFGVATSLTLLEWCDASQPLLRRLAQEAPGTYSHSLILSQMSDEAASTIGGNGLLARVGALYHDIGKVQKSYYFVENQEARMNRHDKLSPTMSLLIIVGHVKDGIEMARAYGLPRVLHQFIAEHHGTTVVKYFHHVATEAAARNPRTKARAEREVPESEFRYPGPRPRSKESAILMICDGCEGAVRALSEPTPGRIEALVHQIVMDRLNDGQFDNCDITLRELNLIEQSLVKSLCAIHHGRIKYPKGDRAKTATAETAAAEDTSESEAEPATPHAPSPGPTTPEVARQT